MKFRITFVILFFALSTIHAENPISRFDQRIFDAIYDEQNDGTFNHKIVKGITHFGDPRAIMGLSMLMMAYGNEKMTVAGRELTTAFIATGSVTYTGKRLIGRHRPLDLLGVEDPAFPSGHTAFAFTTAAVLSRHYPKFRIPFYVGAGLVGFSRIYLGRHYATDVIAGAIVGTVFGLISDRWKFRWEF